MKNIAFAKALALVSGCLVAGCAVGPDFKTPVAPATDRYTVQPLAATPAGIAPQRVVNARDIPAEWWSLFHSDALDAMVRQALVANADLEAAQASLRIAQENVRAQQGTFFPTVGVQFSPTRQSVAPALSSPLASGSNLYSLHTAQLDIAYSPDVFGGNRRQLESLQAQSEVQRFQLEAAQLTLTANLVSTVIQRASTLSQIDATREVIALAGSQLAAVQRQQALGQVGSPDVAVQEALLAQFEAALPPLEKQFAQQRNQLAVLLGRPPSDGEIPQIGLDALQLPAELPLSIPSRLVDQRPDVRAAEAQWHAANAQIGVAVAARLPSLELTANAGSSALRLAQLATSGTAFWGVGASLVQPLFDAGTLMHRQRAAEATQAQAAAQYRSTVLGAFQNVADTLNAIEADAAALAAQTRAEQAAERSLSVVRAQRDAGAAGSLAVLAAQQAWQQASIARVQAQAGRLADSVALFQALGGGWWQRDGQTVRSAAAETGGVP
ncbi:efflux transporter outer membrane subunit [Variovorax sp. RT4R15]|uniref:efflux transporter outer membrane subunit n=1 Tax=Variovorax sp. RT4R15 TaxID=3443737 RepID=UPI003F457A5F